MADEQYRWLDRETAERLLRGESPDAVGPDARDQAERLAQALGALAATPPLTSDELPGEAAALAAFRKARAERDEHHETLAGPARTRPSDAGLFRIGARADGRTTDGARPRRGRPLRLALAATLAAGMVGGVAFAAGTGVLPTPFGDTEPRPAASVSAATPDRPLLTPTPDGTRGGAGAAKPGTGAASGERGEGGTQKGRDGEDRATPSGGAGRSWSEIASACRVVRDGRSLDAGRRRVLEGVAGGSSRVGRYCENVLRGQGGATSGGDTGGSLAGATGGALAGTTGSGQGQGQGQGQGNGDSASGGNDAGGKGNDGKGDGKGEGKGDDGHGTGRPGGNGHGGAGAGENGSGRQESRSLRDPEPLQDPEHRSDPHDSRASEDSWGGRVSPTPQPSLTPPYTTR
ncbi:hypothetical protein [Streptomyces sp. JB150]|uniref:hypothetical protein n=1 Tax=Streptomyces sp. JB150 TaxID=2714844 RepID=UPI00140C2837|nr:hypothetical protein [Streptomyces sp. JB150]QIJ64347.1 hypothetical protein G7Z13_21820 [Streptomyces sp. JB150]